MKIRHVHTGDKKHYRDKKTLRSKPKHYPTSRLQRNKINFCAPLTPLFLIFACIPSSPLLFSGHSQNLEDHLQLILLITKKEKKSHSKRNLIFLSLRKGGCLIFPLRLCHIQDFFDRIQD